MLLNRANHIAFCRQVITVSCALMLSAILPARAEGNKERGAYLARIMDCGGCHTPGALVGKPNEKEPLSGSEIGFAIQDSEFSIHRTLRPTKTRASVNGARPISFAPFAKACVRMAASWRRSCHGKPLPRSPTRMPETSLLI